MLVVASAFLTHFLVSCNDRRYNALHNAWSHFRAKIRCPWMKYQHSLQVLASWISGRKFGDGFRVFLSCLPPDQIPFERLWFSVLTVMVYHTHHWSVVCCYWLFIPMRAGNSFNAVACVVNSLARLLIIRLTYCIGG